MDELDKFDYLDICRPFTSSGKELFSECVDYAANELSRIVVDGKFPKKDTVRFIKMFYCSHLGIKYQEIITDNFHISDQQAARLISVANICPIYFDLAKEIAESSCRRHQVMPSSLSFFVADLISGKTRRPSSSLLTKTIRYGRNLMIVAIIEKIHKKACGNLSFTRNDVAQSKESCCDAVVQGLNRLGYFSLTYDAIKKMHYLWNKGGSSLRFIEIGNTAEKTNRAGGPLPVFLGVGRN